MKADVLDHGRPRAATRSAETTPLRGLADRTAVVTGASSGIGRAIAVAFAAEGAAVCVVGRDPSRLAEAETRTRAAGARDVLAVQAELKDEAQQEALIGAVQDRFGGADILVHSAGSYARAPFETAAVEDLDALYRDNLRAPYRLMQRMLPLLKERQGDLVIIGSTQGLTAGAGVGQYAATHHALKAVADSLRDEVNAAGVRVTLLHVGSTATPRQERIFAATGRPYVPERLLQPEDVAAIVVAAVRLPRTAEVTTLTIRPMQKP